MQSGAASFFLAADEQSSGTVIYAAGIARSNGAAFFEGWTEFAERCHVDGYFQMPVFVVIAGVLVGIDEAGSRRSWTRGELRSDVASVAAHMQRAGVGPGDRVAAWAPNVPEVVIWALAALSIGAVVSTASPDFAPAGVIDRFGQITPRLLLVGSNYTYGGRQFDMRESIDDVLAGLPDVIGVVVIGHDDSSHLHNCHVSGCADC